MLSRKTGYRAVAAVINGLSRLFPPLAGRLAFRIFALTPPPRIRDKEAAFLDGSRQRTLRVGGQPVVVYEWGEADRPVVFCTYGWGYNAGRWRHFVPALLEAGLRVVAYDPPGHGRAGGRRYLDFPTNVAIQRRIIEDLGGIDLAIGHSFGGSCLVDALAQLPTPLRPRRICLMAVVSEVRWLFAGFVKFLGLREEVFRQMQLHIKRISGRALDDYDVAEAGKQLATESILQIHDPHDPVTAYRNAQRNHSHWEGSWLFSPEGAGHHLGTPGVTRSAIEFLTEGRPPATAECNTGGLRPLPPFREVEDIPIDGLTALYE